MTKLIFVIVLVIILSVFVGYLNINGLLGQLNDTISLFPTLLSPFITIYNVIITYPNTMVFILAFLGAQIIRFIFHKLGVYGDD